ncbi:MAG: S41 family peptidase [Erythrobacter sp.]
MTRMLPFSLVLGLCALGFAYSKMVEPPSSAVTTDPVATYDAAWELVRNKYYDVGFNDLDWEGVKRTYRAKALASNGTEELYSKAILPMLELLGTSHASAIAPYGITATASATQSSNAASLVEPSRHYCLGLLPAARLTSMSSKVLQIDESSKLFEMGVRKGWRLQGASYHNDEPSLLFFDQTGRANRIAVASLGIDIEEAYVLAALSHARKSRSEYSSQDSVTLERLGLRLSIGAAQRDAFIGVSLPAGSADRPRVPVGSTIRTMTVTHSAQENTLSYHIDYELAFGQSKSVSGDLPCPPEPLVFSDSNDTLGSLTLGFLSFDKASIDAVLAELEASKHEKLILDLRYNGGGDREQMVRFLSAFLARGTPIGQIEERNKFSQIVARRSDVDFHGEIVVLVGEFTKSAAEVVAHSLRHHHRATIVGDRTAGDVLVAENFQLPDGGRMQVPVGLFRTPDGSVIEGLGVVPDVQLESKVANDSDKVLRIVQDFFQSDYT